MISMQKLRGILGEVNLRTMSRLLAGLVLVAGLLAIPQGAWGDSQTWDGGAFPGSTDYNDPLNWDLDAPVPGTNAEETATFTDIEAGTVWINPDTAHAVEFNFTNTAGNAYLFWLDFNVWQELTGLTTVANGGNVTLSTVHAFSAYTLTGTRSFDIGSDQTTRVSCVIADAGAAGGINKTGDGTLTLSGNNTYTGGTILTAGTLLIGDDNALGTAGLTINGGTFGASAAGINPTNAITVGGSFNLGTTAGDDLTLVQNLALGGSSINHTGAGTDTLAGIVSGAGSAIAVNAGTLILSGANTYTGGTTLTAGTLAAGNNSALGSGGLTINGGNFQAKADTFVSVANNITVNSDFAIGGNSSLHLTGDVDLGGAARTITLNNTIDFTTLSGVISNGGLTTAGLHKLTLGGVNTYTGDTTIGAGSTLALNATGTIAASSGVANSGTFTIAADKTIDSLTGAGATTLGGILTIGDADGTSGTYSGVASGTGGITTAGTGTLTLGGVNTYTGDTTVNGGTLNIAAGGSITSNLNNWGTTAVNGDVFGNVTNNVDAILRGNGTVTGNLNNSGTVNPGNSVGTLNVDGSFTQAAGGTLEVEIESAVSYDKVVVTGAPGTANVDGTLKPILLGGYSPPPPTPCSRISSPPPAG